jgi:hypothetical protein
MAAQVVLRLLEDGADDTRLDDLTRELRAELLELDLDEVRSRSATGPPPAGARAVDAASVGQLVVALTSAGPLVAALGQVLTAWVRRHPDRSVELAVGDKRLTISGGSQEQTDRLIDLFRRELQAD